MRRKTRNLTHWNPNYRHGDAVRRQYEWKEKKNLREIYDHRPHTLQTTRIPTKCRLLCVKYPNLELSHCFVFLLSFLDDQATIATASTRHSLLKSVLFNIFVFSAQRKQQNMANFSANNTSTKKAAHRWSAAPLHMKIFSLTVTSYSTTPALNFGKHNLNTAVC